ncbi:MAG: DoxX subfamily, partial [Cyclobacteriaceae bacterium]|nr:DoxX subfamily [Cyclobacteriaceae bacterium]
MDQTLKYSTAQSSALVLLRLLIGWHFLYEGVIKLYSPAWTAKGYLMSATYLESFFRWMASE